MPTNNKTAYVDLFRDWEGLLDACGANGEKLPGMESLRGPLTDALRKAQELRKFQAGLEGARKRVTRNLLDVCETGSESARRLRGYVKSQLGTKSEELKQFGIAPIGPRPRRKKQVSRKEPRRHKDAGIVNEPVGSERGRTMSQSTRSGKLGEWQRLLAALQVNQAELPHLETQRTQLITLVDQAEDLFQSQAALSASKQEASEQLADLVSECQRLATVLRFSLKQFYGPRAQKLVEFGIQPFRSRSRKPTLPPPPAESTEPSETVSAVE